MPALRKVVLLLKGYPRLSETFIAQEILGGEFDKRSKDYNFEAVQKDIYGQFENTFMMYLPRGVFSLIGRR